jgi:WD40 repeat protein
VWDTEKWEVIAQSASNEMTPVSVSLSLDGRWLVTGDDEGTVRLWEVGPPLREVALLGRHNARVKSVAFSPDGRQVASAGDDKIIALWDVGQRSLVTYVGAHAAPVLAVAFSPDGRRIVSGEHDHSVRLYTRHRTLWGYRLD